MIYFAELAHFLYGRGFWYADPVREADGRLADKECKARPCPREKGVESCAYCDEFPCDKLKPLMADREGMLIYCYPKTASITDEEYNLCMRQFESMPNLQGCLSRRYVPIARRIWTTGAWTS